MSFCCTFSIIGTKETSATITDNFRTVFYPEGCFQIFFALSSSTVSTFAFSYLFQGKPSILDFLTGSISGAILFGSVASFTTNIAAPIAIGIFAAFVSTYYRAHIMKQINKKKVYDMLGLFGPFVLTALIGVIVLSPIVLRSFFNFSLISPPLHGQPITSSNETAFVLIYAGISVGIGLITGMIISTMVRCLSGGEIRFGDNLNFLQDMNI
jgi:ammonia channel protein AmtB